MGRVGFWDWLIHGKGTVDEPWPDMHEVLARPEVQAEIKKVEDSFEKGRSMGKVGIK